jgi:uncharacterized protein
MPVRSLLRQRPLHHWLAAALGLAVVFYLLRLQADLGVSWGPLGPVFMGASRIAEVCCLPLSGIAGLLAPSKGQGHALLSNLLRATMGGLFYAAVARWGVRRLRRGITEGTDTGRRRLLADGVLLGLGALVASLGGWGILVEPSRLRVRRYEVPLDGLPPGLDGLRIGQLSDTHYGPFVTAAHIQRAVALLNAEEVDLVALTGDYVHRRSGSIATGMALLAQARSRFGTVAVLGNAEHWRGADACRAELRGHGIYVIDNDRLFLTTEGLRDHERPEQSLAICGLGDHWGDVQDPDAALRGVSAACPRLMLTHNPDTAEELHRVRRDVRFDIQLSGHTHGGQVRIPNLGSPAVPSRYGRKYAGGVVQGPAWPVLVSRGVGVSVAPLRLGVLPEVVILTLRRG